MTDKRPMQKAKALIRSHYELQDEISDSEYVREIENLRRKANNGNLDDQQHSLAIDIEYLAGVRIFGLANYRNP